MIKKRGFISIILGSSVVFLLVIGNLIWITHGENLYKRGEPFQPFLPPLHPVTQNIFYEPPASRQESETISSGFDDPFQDNGWDTGDEVSIEAYLFQNEPPKTALVYHEYIYNPKISDTIISDIQLMVIRGPDNLKIVENFGFVWFPDETQTGTHTIELGAIISGSTLHSIKFEVDVSEHRYLFGTDKMGRSIGGLIIEGTRYTLLSGFIAVFVALFLGTIAGAVSGYKPGWISDTIDFFVQIIESIPGLLLFFLAAVIFKFNIYWVMLAVGLAYAPVNIKLIRSLVRKFVNNQFVEASKELGFKENVVLWRDIVWVNGRSTLATQTCYCFAFAILAEVTLSYLGIGVQGTDGISWGNLLMESRIRMGDQEYWMITVTGTAIVGTILGFYLLGDGLEKRLDYKDNS